MDNQRRLSRAVTRAQQIAARDHGARSQRREIKIRSAALRGAAQLLNRRCPTGANGIYQSLIGGPTGYTQCCRSFAGAAAPGILHITESIHKSRG